ncbi:hypothetical protein Q0S17_27230, partial [Escherichia coli O2:H6]
KLQDNDRRKTTARNTKKAAQLRSLITIGYYSPAEKLITSRFVVYSLLPASHHAGFFIHKKAPPERGW